LEMLREMTAVWLAFALNDELMMLNAEDKLMSGFLERQTPDGYA
jgi:hypothetical protein